MQNKILTISALLFTLEKVACRVQSSFTYDAAEKIDGISPPYGLVFVGAGLEDPLQILASTTSLQEVF